MDEVLIFDDEDNDVEARRRKRSTQIAQNYEFNQEEGSQYLETDEDDEFVVQDDERFNRKRIRQELGMEDEEEALKDAFRQLRLRRVQEFLNAPIIQRKFRPAYVLLEHIANPHIRKTIWDLLWNQQLKITKLDRYAFEGKCLACDKTRVLSYSFKQKIFNHYLGVMGCDCFEVRFQKLIDLHHICFDLADSVEDFAFYDTAMAELEEIFDRINGAEAEMKRRYSELNQD
jgi:hypothetical protein